MAKVTELVDVQRFPGGRRRSPRDEPVADAW